MGKWKREMFFNFTHITIVSRSAFHNTLQHFNNTIEQYSIGNTEHYATLSTLNTAGNTIQCPVLPIVYTIYGVFLCVCLYFNTTENTIEHHYSVM